jgi:hypothetical protein
MSAAVLPAKKQTVPPEFVGQARMFRNRIAANDDLVGPAVDAITTYAREILRRRPTYRPEHLKHLERAWRLTLPTMGRLAYGVDQNRGSLEVVETRVCSSIFHKGVWDSDSNEQSLTLILYSGRFTSGRIDIESIPVSTVSLHALARRFQRSFNSADEAVLRDLSLISLNAEDLLNSSPFRQPAGDGVWHGQTITVSTPERSANRILAIRTFI